MSVITQEYNACKNKNGCSIVLFKVGNFFEAIKGSAVLVSRLTGLRLHLLTWPQCGFKSSEMENILTMLTSKGHRVGILESSFRNK